MKKIRYRGLSTLEVLEGANNYNNWIAYEMLRFVRSPFLEIGSGIGNLSEKFLSHKPFVVSDNDKGLVRILESRFVNEVGVSSLFLDIEKLPPQQHINNYRSVIAVNVLEHIKDDRAALKNIFRILRKGGTCSLLVPAKQLAYSRLDKELGHYRRYEIKELSKKLNDAGFSVKELYFFNIVGLVSWIVRDKIEKKNIHLKPYQISIFDSIVPFLRFIETKVRPPVGISLIAVVTKK